MMGIVSPASAVCLSKNVNLALPTLLELHHRSQHQLVGGAAERPDNLFTELFSFEAI